MKTPMKFEMTSDNDFYQSNRSQQLRRLTALAWAALDQYKLGAIELEPLHYRTNAIYRVTQSRNGRRFVLRIHCPQTTMAYVRSELVWLDALNADGFTVPQAIAASDGDPILTVAVPKVPEQRLCSLLTWIAGRRPQKRPLPEHVRRIGRQIARLHQHATRFATPTGFARPRWDPDSLLRDCAWQPGWRRLGSFQLHLMGEIASRFRRVAADLGREKEVFGLIHGDFTFENVLFYRREVRVIDFDDCGQGYFLYDIATLLDRMEWREEYAHLRAALLDGYREERVLRREHEELLDLFLLVRWVFLGLAFLSAPDHSPGRNYSRRFLEIVVPKMRKYLRTLPI